MRHREKIREIARLIVDGSDGLFHPIRFTSLLAIDEGPLERTSGHNLAPKLTVESGILPAGVKNPRRFAQHLLAAVSGDRLERRIYILDDALLIGEDDTIADLLHHLRKQHVRLQRALLLGSVMKNHHASGEAHNRPYRPAADANKNSGRLLRAAHKNQFVGEFLAANGASQRQLLGDEQGVLVGQVPAVGATPLGGICLSGTSPQYFFGRRIEKQQLSIRVGNHYPHGQVLENDS